MLDGFLALVGDVKSEMYNASNEIVLFCQNCDTME